jgi:hypothetical protein
MLYNHFKSLQQDFWKSKNYKFIAGHLMSGIQQVNQSAQTNKKVNTFGLLLSVFLVMGQRQA